MSPGGWGGFLPISEISDFLPYPKTKVMMTTIAELVAMTEKFPEPAPTTAWVAFAIYADYDANAPDTKNLFVVSSETLAKLVCEFLNEDPPRWGNLAFVDGFEWAKLFAYRETIVSDSDRSRIRRSVAEVFEHDVAYEDE